MPVPVEPRYSVSVIREIDTGEKDAYGNPIYADVEIPIPAYGWATPGRPGDVYEEGRPYLAVEHLDVYLPFDAPIVPAAQEDVIIAGKTFRVIVVPEEYGAGPFGSLAPAGRRFTARYVSG